MNGTGNETMSTEDFLRELFKNADRGGETNYLQLMGTPVAAQATQGRSAGWNEADHPRDDVGQFTFKEGGGAGQEKRGRVLLASADGKSAPQGDAAQSTSQKRGGTFPAPEPEHGPLWGEVGDKMFDIYVANYEKFRPAWDTRRGRKYFMATYQSRASTSGSA